MKCESCKWYEYVEHNVYYCHSIGTFLEIDSSTRGCQGYETKESGVEE